MTGLVIYQSPYQTCNLQLLLKVIFIVYYVTRTVSDTFQVEDAVWEIQVRRAEVS